jgi:hypothetical protein
MTSACSPAKRSFSCSTSACSKKADEHPVHTSIHVSHPPKASHLVLSLRGGSGGRQRSLTLGVEK